MRTRFALLAALLFALVAIWAARGERASVPKAREGSSDSAAVSKPVPIALADTEPAEEGSSARTALEGHAREAEGEPRLVVRVVEAEAQTTLRDCSAWLEFPDADMDEAEELPDGSFEFRGPIRPGTEIVVQVPEGWEAVADRIELDAVPEDELVFAARPVSMGPVHGFVVDELEGQPLPYQRLQLDGEELVADDRGAFRGVEPHPRGTLEFRAGDWSCELGGWDPELDQPVVVPARVGRTLFLEFDRIPENPWASWRSEAHPASASAIGMQVGDSLAGFSQSLHLDLEPIARAQFRWGMPSSADQGEL